MKRCFLLFAFALFFVSCEKKTTCWVKLNFIEDQGYDVSKIYAVSGANKVTLFKNLPTSVNVSFIGDVPVHIRVETQKSELRGCVEVSSSDCERVVNVGWDKNFNFGRLY